MLKINFRGKKINKLEAKFLISELNSGLISPNLNEQEQKIYKSWKKTTEYFNSLSKWVFLLEKERTSRSKNSERIEFKEKLQCKRKLNLSEKDYLIGELNSKIKVAEFAEKIKYCEKNGHLPKSEHISSGQSGTKLYGECKRCGGGYNRPLSSKEWEKFNKFMNTPMTI